MRPACESDPGRLFSLFATLVRIDSVSRREKRIADFVRDFFGGLGLRCREDSAGERTGGESGNLIIKIPAAGHLPREAPLILNAHLDTVEPGEGIVPVEDGEGFTCPGDTVLGADDKAGVAAILSAIEEVMSSGRARRPLEVVLTVQEELGLAGARNLDFSMIEGRRGIALDGSGSLGGIVTEAPGHMRMRFIVRGRSAHAGIEPEKGVSAIECAAKAIAGLHLGRLDEGTTANIGVIEGGRAVNIVPDLAIVEGEIRSLSDGRLAEEVAGMSRAFRDAASGSGCSLDVETERSFQRFAIDTGSPHVGRIEGAMSRCGIEPFFLKSGGGSDANVFNEMGVETVNINAGFENPHSLRESIRKEDLLALTRLLVELATDVEVGGGACR